jgi:Ca2+-binding EF-hand superfamily protein
MKRAFIISAVAAALVIPGAVYAAKDETKDKYERVEKMFERHDEDKDGHISKDEMPMRWSEHMGRVDTDKDGKISKEEAKAGHDKMKAEHLTSFMMKLDSDSNGELSKEEVTAFVLSKFEKADKDSNGSLTTDEISEARGMMHKERRENRQGRHHGDKDKD